MNLITLVEKKAQEFNLDPTLLHAFITVESGGDPYAVRYEPYWRYFYFVRGYADQLRISVTTEQTLQACSWGLMQVMGSVARELGLKDNLLKLTDPELGLHYGCLKLKSLYSKYGEESDIISAYNQGNANKTSGGMYQNQIYVDKIHAALLALRGMK